MMVELFGLPGAGKTTLANLLEKEHDCKIITISGKMELAWLNFVFFLKRPLNFLKLFFYVLKNSWNFPIFYNKFMNLFLHCNAKYQKALKFERALIDQGYFQSAVALFEKKVDYEDLKKYLDSACLPDRLLIIDLPFEKMKERTAGKDFFAKRYGDVYLWKKLTAISENYHNVLINIENFEIDCKIINAEAEPENICAEAVVFLKS